MYHPSAIEAFLKCSKLLIDFTVLTSGSQFLSENVQRLGFALRSGAANNYAVRPVESANLTRDYRVNADSGWHFFRLEDWGPLIQGDWFGISGTASQTVHGYEFICDVGR